VTPGEERVSAPVARVRTGGRLTRPAALGALALVILAIIVLLLSSGGPGNHYKLLFETGGQLVPGNQVLIGGVPVGSVDDVKLADTGQAQIDISVNRPLHEGSQAIIRATSLSGIANRYVSIQPGPDNAPEIQNGGEIAEVDTTSPVDLDQLFNTLRARERLALRRIIQGSATVYAGKAPEANQTYKYLSPSLVATDRLLSELDRDEVTLTNFIVSGASVTSAVAERRNDLSSLTQNTNEALGAIANENQSFDQALVALPGALRQANTTFHNLRPALDDLDGLVNASKTGTKDLPTFLQNLKPVVTRSVPVFKDLNRAVNLKGKNNDLADAFAALPAAESGASASVGPTDQALNDALPTLTFLRPYSPDLLATIGSLNKITAYYDANGHYARVEPAGLGIFHYAGPPTNTLVPIPPSQIVTDYGPFGGASQTFNVFRRCPGAGTQPANDGPPPSNPFVTPPWAGTGINSPGDCNGAPTTQPPGP